LNSISFLFSLENCIQERHKGETKTSKEKNFYFQNIQGSIKQKKKRTKRREKIFPFCAKTNEAREDEKFPFSRIQHFLEKLSTQWLFLGQMNRAREKFTFA
jgi:hypothetical protein